MKAPVHERPIGSVLRLTLTCLYSVVIFGCATSNVATSGFTSLQQGTGIVLMPPDIKIFRLTASGVTEPIAEWTDEARQKFDQAFQEFAQANQLRVTRASAQEQSDLAIEYDRLHSAVGSTILGMHFGMTKLPSKDGAFDWTLGGDVAHIAPHTDERYALFVYFRDYEASGGRVGVAVFASLLGASVYTGHQGGFASLVDLETGDVVWFNNLPIAQGNMRNSADASRLIKQLFAELTEPLER